jgi:hypothetical protein
MVWYSTAPTQCHHSCCCSPSFSFSTLCPILTVHIPHLHCILHNNLPQISQLCNLLPLNNFTPPQSPIFRFTACTMLSQFYISSSCHTTVTGCTHPHSVQPLQVLLPVFNDLVTCKNTLVLLRLGLLIVHHHLHAQLLPLQLCTQHKLSAPIVIMTPPTKTHCHFQSPPYD